MSMSDERTLCLGTGLAWVLKTRLLTSKSKWGSPNTPGYSCSWTIHCTLSTEVVWMCSYCVQQPRVVPHLIQHEYSRLLKCSWTTHCTLSTEVVCGCVQTVSNSSEYCYLYSTNTSWKILKLLSKMFQWPSVHHSFCWYSSPEVEV